MEEGHESRTLIANAKAWIEEQEKAIKRTGSAPQLTQEQVEALKLLRVPQTLAPPEPDLEGQNWVGLLLEHYQANPPNKSPVSHETSVLGPNGTLRWQCHIVIADHPDPFPRPEDWQPLGYTSMPSWAKKKEAKQYAHKCALQWLSSRDENGSTSTAGCKGRKSKKQSTSSSNAPNNGDDSSWWTKQPSSSIPDEHDDQHYNCEEPPESQRPILPATAKSSSSNSDVLSSSSSSDTSVMDADDLPMTKQVADLCNRLKVNVPSYKITPSKPWHESGNHQLFDGYASWGYDGPAGLLGKVGDVSGILSKRGCKEKVAEEALKALKLVEKQRQNDFMRATARGALK